MQEEDSIRLPPRSLNNQWWFILASVGVFAMASLLTVLPSGEQVAFKGFEHKPLPESCFLRSQFSLGCAGCGLTRSTIFLTHGNWQASVDAHPLGWLIALTIAGQIPYRFWILSSGNRYPIGRTPPWILMAVVAFLLMANWLIQIGRQFL